jgi:upstream activation factor subunit UAF30
MLYRSSTLAKFIGQPVLGRTQVVKRIWAYVKEQGLQDPKDGRIILCDDVLAPFLGKQTTAFGSYSISLFVAMNKSLSAHIGEIAEDGPDLPEDTELTSDGNGEEGSSKAKKKRKIKRALGSDDLVGSTRAADVSRKMDHRAI